MLSFHCSRSIPSEFDINVFEDVMPHTIASPTLSKHTRQASGSPFCSARAALRSCIANPSANNLKLFKTLQLAHCKIRLPRPRYKLTSDASINSISLQCIVLVVGEHLPHASAALAFCLRPLRQACPSSLMLVAKEASVEVKVSGRQELFSKQCLAERKPARCVPGQACRIDARSSLQPGWTPRLRRMPSDMTSRPEIKNVPLPEN